MSGGLEPLLVVCMAAGVSPIKQKKIYEGNNTVKFNNNDYNDKTQENYKSYSFPAANSFTNCSIPLNAKLRI